MNEHDLNDNVMKHARTRFISVRETFTVDEAIQTVRDSKKMASGARIVYFYVVDEEGVLKGTIDTRKLLMSDADVVIRDIMSSKLTKISDKSTLLDACEFFLLHRLLALPIVNDKEKIVGVIDVELYTDKMTDIASEVESEDFFQLIGVRLASVQKASLPVVFQNRFPWLLCNVAGGLLAAFIAGLFQTVLDQVVVLTLFIPVVLALAESVSIQSLTLALQAHHGQRRPSLSEILKSLAHEFPIGILLGLGCAILIAGTVWMWKGNAAVAGIAFVSICISITCATMIGLLIPSVVRYLKFNPQIASGPITLALTDVTTLVIYLWMASKVLL